MSPIKKILYQHWLILFGVLLGVFLSSAELTALKPFSQYILPSLRIWYVLTIMVSTGVLIFTLTKLLRNRGPTIRILPPPLDPPTHKYPQSERLIDHAGVKWKVWLGYDEFASGEEDQRVWVEGPYCPKCLYELDLHKTGKKWRCLKCKEYIPIPKDLREDTIEKMIKILTADLERLKRQKHNNLSSQP